MAGRPSKYSADMQSAADDYVNGGYQGAGDCIPSVAGLAVELDVNRSTLQEWEKKFPQFSGTLQKCKDIQERLAISGGLRGDFNAAITKLILANYGYSDKQALDHTSSDGSMKPSVVVLPAKDAG